ncbi:MAG: LysM domain-containing protein [Chloroflexi bacterium]|nr:LysM domain-containing protein [Chloroflexota bacterium]MCY4248201.1 LysM domain-containing protein [Chloroflexota bacterium]
MLALVNWKWLPAFRYCLVALWMLGGGGLLRGQDSAGDDLVHIVAANETLTFIAEAYGIAVSELISRNSLDNPDILSVGERLLIFTAEERRQRAETSPTATPGEAASVALGAGLSAEILAAAPLTPAAAPKVDLSEQRAALCLVVYDDGNENGMLDPGETPLANASIRLLDTAGLEQQRIISVASPFCQRDLSPSGYQLLISPPPGYGLTTPAQWQIQLQAGRRLDLEIGARQGRQALSALAPGVSVAEAPPLPSIEEPSLLYRLSGLLLLALAGLTLVCGFGLALFVRTR